jgi:tRNA (guanine37-N1)-methyltransferase
MKITILTLFPESFSGFLQSSIIGRAQKQGLVKIDLVNLRDFAKDDYGSVDDKPYGGGVGMVLRVDVVVPAIRQLQTKESKVILLTPQGQTFKQNLAKKFAHQKHLILVAGHYEGFDERIREYADLELSIGDYVLTGGELPAAVVSDAIVRLKPGVLGKKQSSIEESFSQNLLEYPQYTRPEEFEGKKVPAVLLSGNHGEIAKWRTAESKKVTKRKRPDLFKV